MGFKVEWYEGMMAVNKSSNDLFKVTMRGRRIRFRRLGGDTFELMVDRYSDHFNPWWAQVGDNVKTYEITNQFTRLEEVWRVMEIEESNMEGSALISVSRVGNLKSTLKVLERYEFDKIFTIP